MYPTCARPVTPLHGIVPGLGFRLLIAMSKASPRGWRSGCCRWNSPRHCDIAVRLGPDAATGISVVNFHLVRVGSGRIGSAGNRCNRRHSRVGRRGRCGERQTAAVVMAIVAPTMLCRMILLLRFALIGAGVTMPAGGFTAVACLLSLLAEGNRRGVGYPFWRWGFGRARGAGGR